MSAEAQRIFVDAVANSRPTLVMEDIGISELPALIATSIAEGYKLPFATVSLKGNRLTTIPPELVHTTHLRILFLDRNRIASLIPPFSHLSCLQYLSLRANRLSELPPQITDLVGLQTLDVSDNFVWSTTIAFAQHPQLTSLPVQVAQMRNLRNLNTRGNLGLHRLPGELAKQLNIVVEMEHPVEFPPDTHTAKDVLEYVCAVKARGFPIDLCNHWKKNDGLCSICSTGTGLGGNAANKGKNCRLCGRWICSRCTAPNKYVFPCFEVAEPLRVCSTCAHDLRVLMPQYSITTVAAERSMRVTRPSAPADAPPQPTNEAETQALDALKSLQELKAAHTQQLDSLYSDLDTPATPEQKRATRAAINTLALQLLRLNDKVSSLISKIARREEMPRGTQPDPAVAAEILEHMYDDLGELATSCDARLMRVLAKSVTRDEVDHLARTLLLLMPSRQPPRSLLRALINDEIAVSTEHQCHYLSYVYFALSVGLFVLPNTAEAGALFRHNSFSAAFISAHQRQMNPVLLKIGESAADNALALESMVHRLLHSLLSSIDSYPSSLRELWAEVTPVVAAKFSTLGPRLLVCSLFLLRFVAPAIVSPDTWGVVDEPQSIPVKRSLMLLGSMMQKAANNTPYMAKDHLMITNRVIQDLQPSIVALVDALCVPPPAGNRPKSPELPAPEVPQVERQSHLRQLHAQLKAQLPRLERDLEPFPDQYQGLRLYDALVARLGRLPPPVIGVDEKTVRARSPSPTASPPGSPRMADKISISPGEARSSPLLERRLVARDKALTVSLNNSSGVRAAGESDGAVADFVMQLQVNDQVMKFQALMAAEGCVWSGTDTGYIYTWATDGKQLRSFQAHQKTVYSIVRFRTTAWSSSSEGVIRVWPLELPEKATAVRLIRELPIAQNHKVLLLAQPNHVISFDTSGAICIWNADASTPERTLQLLSSVGVGSVAQLDDSRVWLGLSTGELQQLSLKTWELSEPWRAHKRRIAQLLAAGDVVWSSGDNDTTIWDANTRQMIKELPIKLVSAFYDGMHVWGYNGAEKGSTNITVWEARTGKVLQHMTRHKDTVHSFALLNKNVWASSGDSSISVWQLRSAPPAATAPAATTTAASAPVAIAGATGVAPPSTAAGQTATPGPRWTKPQLPGRSTATADPGLPSEGPGSPARGPRAGSIRMSNPLKPTPTAAASSPAAATRCAVLSAPSRTSYGTPPRGPKGARVIEDVIQAAERAEMALGGPTSKPTPQMMDIDAPLFVSRWSFRPTNSNCLRLRAGDVVKVVDRSHSEWWYGVTNGSAGYFPGNYVTPTKPRQESVTEPPSSLIWTPDKEKEAKAAGSNASEDVLMRALFSNNP